MLTISPPQVKERGLLLTEENAIAAIEGRKTQTRRVIYPDRKSIYGKVGDLLYLQEPTEILAIHDLTKIPAIQAIKATVRYRDGVQLDQQISQKDLALLRARKNWKRKASGRFMLKSFARYWFLHCGEREEKLQDISEADAIAEGIQYFADLPSIHPWGQDPRWGWGNPSSTEHCLQTARHAFGNLWNSINSKRGIDWASNPTVRAISFKRCDR